MSSPREAEPATSSQLMTPAEAASTPHPEGPGEVKFAGMHEALRGLADVVYFLQTGIRIRPSLNLRSILLLATPGTGLSLARAIAHEAGVPLFRETAEDDEEEADAANPRADHKRTWLASGGWPLLRR